MNLSKYDYFGSRKKVTNSDQSKKLSFENTLFSEISSNSSQKTPRKPIRTLPDTPEQFLNSSYHHSKNSYYQDRNSPALAPVYSLSNSVDKRNRLSTLEISLKTKEKKIAEDDFSLKQEKEDFLKKKNFFEAKFLKKKEKLAKIKAGIKEEQEYLNKKISEMDEKYREVKEMIQSFEKNKERFKENIRNDLLNDIKSTKSLEESFEAEKSVENDILVNKLDQKVQEQSEMIKNKETEILRTKQELSRLERTHYELLKTIENKDVIIENLKSEIADYRSRLENSGNARTNPTHVQFSEGLAKKQEELSVLSQVLNRKSEDLNLKQVQIDEQSIELQKAASLLKNLSFELESKKKEQEEKDLEIEQSLLKISRITAKLEERENLIKQQEEKIKAYKIN